MPSEGVLHYLCCPIETQIGRWKTVISPKLKAHNFENQKTEATIGVQIPNQMTELGRPNIQRNADVLAVTFRSDYLFAVGSANLNAGAFDEISRVSRVLNQYPDTSIQVAGHTDSTGSEQTNQTLSENRADNVKNALVGQGVHPNRISTLGFGESAPIADNSAESGRQLNRRVVITIKQRNS